MGVFLLAYVRIASKSVNARSIANHLKLTRTYTTFGN